MNITTVVVPNIAETSTTRLIKYVFLQTLQIPALLCSIFIFHCVCRERELRRLHNHAMLLIVGNCFFLLIMELSITLSFLHSGSLEPQSDRLCLYWIFINYTLQASSNLLMAFASVERFVLIFYSNTITGSLRRRLLFHYLPMIFCCIIVIIWYSTLIFINSCVNTFDSTSFLCNYACYQSNILLGTIDWIGSVLLPVLIVVVSNVVLVIRAILQKRHMGLRVNWRRTRKMLVQLFAIVFMFLCTQIPLTIFAVIRLIWDPNFLNSVLTLWYYFSPYLIFLMLPFAYVITTKEVSKYLTVWKICKSRRVTDLSAATIRHPKNTSHAT